MNNQAPNGELPTLTNPRDEEFLERTFRRLEGDIKNYVLTELNQQGWSYNGNAEGTGATINNQVEAMAIILSDKIVREGRQQLSILREDYKKKMM